MAHIQVPRGFNGLPPLTLALNVVLRKPLFARYTVVIHYTAVAPYMYQHDTLIARLSEMNQGFACQAVKAKIVLLLFPG